jgi:hypothetical protein
MPCVNRTAEPANGWAMTQEATAGAILLRLGKTCVTPPLFSFPILIFHYVHRTGLHFRSTREPVCHASAARARRAAATLDGTVRPTEPRLDRVATRSRVRRGVLEWPRRQPQCGAAPPA